MELFKNVNVQLPSTVIKYRSLGTITCGNICREFSKLYVVPLKTSEGYFPLKQIHLHPYLTTMLIVPPLFEFVRSIAPFSQILVFSIILLCDYYLQAKFAHLDCIYLHLPVQEYRYHYMKSRGLLWVTKVPSSLLAPLEVSHFGVRAVQGRNFLMTTFVTKYCASFVSTANIRMSCFSTILTNNSEVIWFWGILRHM